MPTAIFPKPPAPPTTTVPTCDCDPSTEAPNPAVLIAPAEASQITTFTATLSWASSPDGALPTGFKLYFGSTNPPAFVADLGGATTYTTEELEYDTTYYWQVVPYNIIGDATDCPVWSFNSMANPIVSSFPWTVDFGTASTDLFPPLNWSRMAGQYPAASGLQHSLDQR